MIKPYMWISYANAVNRLVTGSSAIEQRRRSRTGADRQGWFRISVREAGGSGDIFRRTDKISSAAGTFAAGVLSG